MKSIYGLLALLLFSGCNGVSNIFEQKSNDTATTIADSITKPATSVLESTGDETVINVEPTLIRPQLFLMMKDVADDDKEANVKQATIFNNLDFILKKYNLAHCCGTMNVVIKLKVMTALAKSQCVPM